MMQNDRTIETQTLMDLGLTCLQAKIYLTLTQLETAGTKKISAASTVARQDIYRIIPSLQKLGLAEKIISDPIMYRAIPLKNGLALLLQQKTERYNELQQKAKSLSENFPENDTKLVFKDDAQFIMTYGKKLLFKNLEKIVSNAQTRLDVICRQEGIRLMLVYALPHMKKAIKRGVKIRILTDEAGRDLLLKNQTKLEKMIAPTFQFKYSADKLTVATSIYDNKEVMIGVSSGEIVPSLWTNNPSVLSLAKIFFENAWGKSIPIKDKLQRESKC